MSQFGGAAPASSRSGRQGRPAARLHKLNAAEGEGDAAAPAAASGSNATFYIGILWFMIQLIIGVGNDVIMKYVGGNLQVAQVVFLRFFFATLSMLPVIAISGPASFKTQRIPLHIARSFLLAAGIGLYCQGLQVAPIAVVTTLNFTIPMFTLILSRVFLKETVALSRWIATLGGFVGVTVVLQPWSMLSFDPRWSVILLSASMFACLDVMNKFFVDKESFWSMIFYTALFTALICAYPAYMCWAPVTTTQLGLLALLGGGANALLFALLKAFSMVDASALAPFRYAELILSALVGWMFFAEVPAMSTLLGALVIIPSTLLVIWKGSGEE